MIEERLRNGHIEVLGRHPHASNHVFLVEVTGEAPPLRAIYKPIAGERPLWDFPGVALARREVAAYAVSEAMGLGIVPTTVWREDAPLGAGSLQRWIEDAELIDVDIVRATEPGWLRVLDAELEDGTAVQVVHRDLPELRALALFDAVINNGDRKAGHILRDGGGQLWVVDHGVSFHVEPKLRSVIWGFEQQPIAPELLALLDLDLTGLPEVVAALVDAEMEALVERMATLRTIGLFPGPPDAWPSIPWPIF